MIDPNSGAKTSVAQKAGGCLHTNNAGGGDWMYSVDAQYQVTGMTKAWTSSAPQLGAYC